MGRFFSVRVEPPENFKTPTGKTTCRTQVLGGRHGTTRIACKDPDAGEWKTQGFRLPKSGYEKCGEGICAKDDDGEKVLDKLELDYGIIRHKKTGGDDDFTTH